MKLTKLTLRNFKGIREKTIEAPRGCSLNIFGDNATGKTTLADAITFVLFDKDTAGRSPQNFGIKTVDESGGVIHNLQHEVQASFVEPDITLRKVYQEKWTRSRGSSHKDLSGHTTDYYVDDEPVKKKDYDARVAEIMSEEQFKILTVPNYFAEQMHWSDRRKTLAKMAGEIDTQTILDSDPELDGYLVMLDGKTAESKKKILTDQRKKCLEQIDNIPDRIDENVRAIVDIDQSEVSGDMESLKEKKTELEEQLAKARSGGGVSDLQVKIEEIETKKQKLVAEHGNKFDATIQAQREALNKANKALDDHYIAFDACKKDVRATLDVVEMAELNIETIKKKIQEVEAREPNPAPSQADYSDGECPYCGQEMPEADDRHDPQAEYEEYLAEFNEEKAEELKDLSGDLEMAQKEYAEAQKELDKAKEKLSQEEQVGTELKDRSDAESEKLRKLKDDIPDVKQSEEYVSLANKQATLNKRVDDIRQNNREHITEIQGKISNVSSEISKIEELKFEIKKNTERRERIEELKDELKTAHKRLEEAEQGLYMIQRFEVAQAQVVTDRVNKMFDIVTWKMFEPQINGGINDQMCEPVVGGVPYSDGLNNAMRIQAGLDIINTLGNHFGKSAPVIIDNAESIVKIDKYDLQVIALYVSAAHKQLSVKEAGK
jgi:DNA repair exonuclease SbcCD ATPase subunit